MQHNCTSYSFHRVPFSSYRTQYENELPNDKGVFAAGFCASNREVFLSLGYMKWIYRAANLVTTFTQTLPWLMVCSWSDQTKPVPNHRRHCLFWMTSCYAENTLKNSFCVNQQQWNVATAVHIGIERQFAASWFSVISPLFAVVFRGEAGRAQLTVNYGSPRELLVVKVE